MHFLSQRWLFGTNSAFFCCTFVSILELFNTIPSGQLLPLCVTFLLLSFMCVLSWFNPFAVDGFQQGSCDLSQFASWVCIYIYHWNLKTEGGWDIFSLRVSIKKSKLNLCCTALAWLFVMTSYFHFLILDCGKCFFASLLLAEWRDDGNDCSLRRTCRRATKGDFKYVNIA